jgi:hypothetical protein
MFGDPHPLYALPQGVQTRWASPENPRGQKGRAARANAGRKGSACFPLQSGESRLLAEESGASGTVRRIWVTINDRSPQMLRGLRLDFYWDGADHPAVSAPLGDFFGTGLGRMSTFQCALFSSAEGRSFNCTIPMPFKQGMRMVVTNEAPMALEAFYYDVDYTLGDAHEATAPYLHAHYRRENPTIMQRDYQILPRVNGRGRFLGCNVGVIAGKALYYDSWWGEGELKVYLDGDADWPTLSGTGTEDYIGTGWGMGFYANAYQGCHVAEGETMSYCFYRYHIPDPIYFQRDCRVAMQQMGCWAPQYKEMFRDSGRELYHAGSGRRPIDFSASDLAPYGLFERQDDWSSCAYFYLDSAENGLPELAPVEERIAGL